MDPVSLTAAVLTIIVRTVTTVHKCHDYAVKYNIADLTIASMRTECSTIQIALLQIQQMQFTTARPASKKREDDPLLVQHKEILGACAQTFTIVNGRLAEIGLDNLNERGQLNFKSRFKALWSESRIEMVLQNIRGLAIALTTLLTVFQCDTAAKTYELLQSQGVRAAFRTATDDTTIRSIWTGTPTLKDDQSVLDSLIGDEEFDFDDEVINSKAYRRAFAIRTRENVKQGSEHQGSLEEDIDPQTKSGGNLSSDQKFSRHRKADFQATSTVAPRRSSGRVKRARLPAPEAPDGVGSEEPSTQRLVGGRSPRSDRPRSAGRVRASRQNEVKQTTNDESPGLALFRGRRRSSSRVRQAIQQSANEEKVEAPTVTPPLRLRSRSRTRRRQTVQEAAGEVTAEKSKSVPKPTFPRRTFSPIDIIRMQRRAAEEAANEPKTEMSVDIWRGLGSLSGGRTRWRPSDKQLEDAERYLAGGV